MKGPAKKDSASTNQSGSRGIPLVYHTGTSISTNPTPTLSSSTTTQETNQERSICFICATDHPKLWAIFECSHRICFTCALRLRHLYDNRRCVWCKTESERVIIVRARVDLNRSHEHTQSFEDLWSQKNSLLPGQAPRTDFYFEDENGRREVMGLLKLSCNVPGCSKSKEFTTLAELKRHVQLAHQLLTCDICQNHRKTFPSEYRYYRQTGGDLVRHQKGQLDGAGHPPCRLCGTLFYSEDELTEHCRQRHEACFICQRQAMRSNRASRTDRTGRIDQVGGIQESELEIHYRDYGELEAHFKSKHFLCTDPMCLELKFIVFETELEYKAHMAEVHLSNSKMQRSAQRQLIRLDTGFTYGQRNDNQSSRKNNKRDDLPTRSSNETTASTSSSSAATITTAVPSLSKETLENLIYGEAIGDLVGRLQSLSLYDQRNRELCDRLQSEEYGWNKHQLEKFKGFCRQFQRGQLGGAQLLLRLEGLVVGKDSRERIMEGLGRDLADLQLDVIKKKELEYALSAYLRRLKEFPSLPEGEQSKNSMNKHGASTSYFNVGQRSHNNIKPIVPVATIRIRPSTKVAGSTRGLDPSKNPLALLGPIKSTAALRTTFDAPTEGVRKPKKKLPPSFTQALSSSSSVGVVSGALEESPHLIDEQQFPSLFGIESHSIRPTGGNIFAVNRDNQVNEPESFVLGRTTKQTEQLIPTEGREANSALSSITSSSSPLPSSSRLLPEESSKKKKKKKEKTVLIKYG